MSKSTRPSLTAAMQQVAKPQNEKPAAAEGNRAADKRKLTIRLDPAMHRELRHLAADLDSSIDAIVVGLIASELAKRRGRH